MTRKPNTPGAAAPRQELPWYRYPWPWVAIAIPGAAVIGGFFTLYLAITNPDPLVLDEQQYDQLHSEMKVDPATAPAAGADARDGEQR